VQSGPCVVSGPEVCFNATDDNCNGLLDEGCGVRMGLVQFMAAWSEPNVDVDLEVVDPSGEVAQVGHVSQSGLTLQQDCPGKQRLCYGQNYENVYLDSGAPASGRYQVTVRLEALADAEPPVVVRLGARIDGASHAALIRLDRDGAEESVSFVMPPISESRSLGVASTKREPSPR
jgi:tRNA (guanosine-2'-O-)-methyltransferase